MLSDTDVSVDGNLGGKTGPASGKSVHGDHIDVSIDPFTAAWMIAFNHTANTFIDVFSKTNLAEVVSRKSSV